MVRSLILKNKNRYLAKSNFDDSAIRVSNNAIKVLIVAIVCFDGNTFKCLKCRDHHSELLHNELVLSERYARFARFIAIHTVYFSMRNSMLVCRTETTHPVGPRHRTILHVGNHPYWRRFYHLEQMAMTLVNRVHLVTVTFFKDNPWELEVHNCRRVKLIKPVFVFSFLVQEWRRYQSQSWLDVMQIHHFSFVVLPLHLWWSNALDLEGFD